MINVGIKVQHHAFTNTHNSFHPSRGRSVN